MKLTRARDIAFELPDGRSFTVAPPTIGQVRECFALDPSPNKIELPIENRARIALQVEALFPAELQIGECKISAAQLIDSITSHEAVQIIQAMIAHMHGIPDDQLQEFITNLQKKMRLPTSPATT